MLTCPDEYEGWVQGDVGEQAQVVEGVLLRPGPDANGQDAEPDEPEDHVEAKDDILEAAADLGLVTTSPSVMAAAGGVLGGGGY